MFSDSPHMQKRRKLLSNCIPGTKLSNLKNTTSVDSKDLSVYITRHSAGEITDHLVMSKKKSNDPKYRRGWLSPKTKNRQIR